MSEEEEDPLKPTEEEIGWAKAIKSLVEANKKLKNLSDLEYLHHAIVAKDNVKKAMKRIERMEAFKLKYGIEGDGNYQHGCQVIEQFLIQQPNAITGIGIDSKGRYVCSMDYKMFLPKSVKTDQDWNVLMAGLFYIFQALQPNVSAIRHGCVWLCECRGMGWKNFSLEIEKRSAEFYSDAYPMRIKEMGLLDPHGILHAVYKIIKVFLSQKIKDVVCMENKEKYLETRPGLYPNEILPSSLGGTITEQQFVQTYQSFLKERYETVTNFNL